ncbi:MAG: multicopper oxidase family protein [Terriglobales bacterium]
MTNRRDFIKISALAAGALALPKWTSRLLAQVPGGTLPPGDIPKYVTPLVIPPAMPRTSKIVRPMAKNIDYYEIAVRQFQQHILPPAMGLPTTVWSYGAAAVPGTVFAGGSFHYPALTIEAKWNAPVRVKWINDLVDGNGNYLPHLLPVDQTVHWANPLANHEGHSHDHGPYTGPVPIVTHLHGGHSYEHSDGYPEAWYLPAAKNIPAGYRTVGSYYNFFGAKAQQLGISPWEPGTATFEYPNDQRATTLWYHDHTLGMTRLNVYAGPAGFYLLRGGPADQVLDTRGRTAILPGPAPALGDPAGMKYYEIAIVVQDRSFNADGSLFYPDNRAFFEGLTKDQLRIPFYGDPACDGGMSDISPIWNPEFFGNTIVVNGRTWPYLEVEQRRYRFRFLNGCNSRFLVLKFDDPRVDVWQIGTEGGFLPAPVRINDLDVGGLGGVLLMGLAERADVIADFTNVPAGSTITLLNLGPDEPFGGFPTPESDPGTTGQIMQFRVVPATSRDVSTPPQQLVLPAIPVLAAEDALRGLSLNEEISRTVKVPTDADGNFILDANGNLVLDCEKGEFFGPKEAVLGIMNANGTPKLEDWNHPITEKPALDATEVWEINNFTEDAHPIHIHMVMFQVVNREVIETGEIRPPEAWETGEKDTVIAYPGEITRVKAKFDRAGRFVWHCHIIEHEDNEMMRPYQVGL